MSFTIYVRMKKPGGKRNMELPAVAFELDKKPETVRELLLGLTTLGVRDYNARKDEGQLLPFLTKEEITSQAARGKVFFGVHEGEEVDFKKACENSLQCFEDGIYRVFAGEEELTGLTDRIPWKEDMIFTMIRLTMLAGSYY